MRYVLHFAVILTTLCTQNVSSLAQDTILVIRDAEDRPEMEIETKRFRVTSGAEGVQVIRNEFEQKVVNRFLLLDIGFTGYLFDGSLDLPADIDDLDLRGGRSRNIILHLVQQRFYFAGGHMELNWGLMFDFNKYRFVNDIQLIPDSIPLGWTTADEGFRKNTLKASYFGMPLMIGFRSNPEKLLRSFRMKAGGYAEVLMNSKQKSLREVTDRTKVKDDFNLSRFQYGIRGEMGYGLLNLYVQYSFNTLFKDGQGPALNPIKFGVILVPY